MFALGPAFFANSYVPPPATSRYALVIGMATTEASPIHEVYNSAGSVGDPIAVSDGTTMTRADLFTHAPAGYANNFRRGAPTLSSLTVGPGAFIPFNTSWVMHITGSSLVYNGGLGEVIIRFYNAGGTEQFRIESVHSSGFSYAIRFYNSSNTLVATMPIAGSNPQVYGQITFTSGSVIYTNKNGTNHVDSGSYSTDTTTWTQIKVTSITAAVRPVTTDTAYGTLIRIA